MSKIKVHLKERSYNIDIGRGVLSSLGKRLIRLGIGSDCYIITNTWLKNKYSGLLETALKPSGFAIRYGIVPDSEKSKSFGSACKVLKDLAAFDKKKNIFVLAFGGGVIGDLSAFIASIYRRGIPYIQIPTTLLAQVDSSIGGKAAVDMSAAKNLVGAVYQPKAVFSDTGLLRTLPCRQIKAGLAEIIKYGVIKDPGLFDFLEKNYKSIISLDEKKLVYVITRCVKIKAAIVSRDEFDRSGARAILNFGHTIAHAIEAAGGYCRYNHGEAVALGMLVAMDISGILGLAVEKSARRIEVLIRKIGLPCRIRGIDIDGIIKAHYHDKKFKGSRNRFVLFKDIGKIKIVEDVPLTVIKEAVRKRFKS